MSQPPATLGTPTPPPALPNSSSETPHTYGSGSGSAPISPSAPTPAAPSGPPADRHSYRLPDAIDTSHAIEGPRIEGVPPVVDKPQHDPTPAAPTGTPDRVTSRPVIQAGYFQLLSSPPATVPVQPVSTTRTGDNPPADDGGWEHVGP
jgi:hypothetical protein